METISRWPFLTQHHQIKRKSTRNVENATTFKLITTLKNTYNPNNKAKYKVT